MSQKSATATLRRAIKEAKKGQKAPSTTTTTPQDDVVVEQQQKEEEQQPKEEEQQPKEEEKKEEEQQDKEQEEQQQTEIKVTTIQNPATNTLVNIAVIGCVHGELNQMYQTIQHYELNYKKPIHIVLCCGDFQSMRNSSDLMCMACPSKYRAMVDFFEYYNGTRTAPYLTLFTHGNHEASNFLMELPYGGWVAKNIYYMGFAGVLNFFGLTIGSIGGIFKSFSYNLPRHEACPLNEHSMRSLYHTRSFDILSLMQYRKPLDVMISHDWPHVMAAAGDVKLLTQHKPHFIDDIKANRLGSPASSLLLHRLKPAYWFAAHLHYQYQVAYYHNDKKNDKKTEDNTTDQKNEQQQQQVSAAPSDATQPTLTRFIALDKVVRPGRFLQIIHRQAHPTYQADGNDDVVVDDKKKKNNKKNDTDVVVAADTTGGDDGDNANTHKLAAKQYPVLAKQQVTPQELMPYLTYDAQWVFILQQMQLHQPRASLEQDKSSKLNTTADAAAAAAAPAQIATIPYTKKNHKEYYQQYDGTLCSCIAHSTTRQELFYTSAPICPQIAALYTTTTTTAEGKAQEEKKEEEEENKTQEDAKKDAIAKKDVNALVVIDNKKKNMTNNNNNTYNVPAEFIPTAIPAYTSQHTTTPLPPFLFNPQTIDFCNRYQLLVPVFNGEAHWCSPYHAAQLYKEQIQKQLIQPATIQQQE